MTVAPERRRAWMRGAAIAINAASGKAAVARIVLQMPPPEARICSYVTPEVRASKSARRSPAQTACVCGSIRPATTARLPRSTRSVAVPVHSCWGPTHSILPSAIAMAAYSMPSSERISRPRFGPEPWAVTSCEIPVTSRSAFIALFEAGHVEAALLCDGDGFFVAGVGVADDAEGRIVPQTETEALLGFLAAVGDGDESGVLAVAHADAAAVVKAHPRSAAGDAGGEVEQRPVGDGVGAVAHGFRFAVGTGDGTGVEVIASDDDGRFQAAVADHFVEEQASAVALSVAEPADARRQSLEGDLVGSVREPAMEALIVGEERQQSLVGGGDVGGISGERDPAEGPPAFAECVADERRDKAGIGEGVGHAGKFGLRAEIVAVVEGDCSALLHGEDGAHVRRDGVLHAAGVALGIFGAEGVQVFVGARDGDVSPERVVGAGLVGDEVGGEADLDHAGQDFGGVPHQADGDGLAPGFGLLRERERLVERGGGLVEIARLKPALDAVRIDLHADTDAAGELDCERLRAAHAAEPGGDRDGAGEGLVEVPVRGALKSFVGALQNSLRPDVDPGTRGHLAVHHEAGLVEAVEFFPGGPVRHQ